jgi:predicted nucleotidyltransferase
MLTPNLEIGRRFVDSEKPPGKILLCAVTGSHHYGFPSQDSDLDLKGIHLSPTADLLGLTDPVETRDRLTVFEGVECDYTSHEAKKALTLLIAGNGNMLERILSPFQLFETAQSEALRRLARGALSKRFAGHYKGYFKGRCAEHLKAPVPTAKTMLYSYRVALTGIHLLGTCTLEADINVTAPEYGFDEVLKLVRFKREAGEKAALPGDLDLPLRKRWSVLEEMLSDALEKSPLPLEPQNREEISTWLRMERLKMLDGEA